MGAKRIAPLPVAVVGRTVRPWRVHGRERREEESGYLAPTAATQNGSVMAQTAETIRRGTAATLDTGLAPRTTARERGGLLDLRPVLDADPLLRVLGLFFFVIYSALEIQPLSKMRAFMNSNCDECRYSWRNCASSSNEAFL